MFSGALTGRTAFPRREARARFDSLARYLLEKLRVTVEWIATQKVSVSHESYDAKRYVESSEACGIYEGLGVPAPLQVPSSKLIPRQSFHQITTAQLPGLPAQRARVPYHRVNFVDDLYGDLTAVSSLEFRGQVLVTRVRAMLDLKVGELGSTVASLGRLRSAKELPAVCGLIRAMAGTVQGRPRRPDRALSFSQYFLMRIVIPATAREVDEMAEALRSEFAALLIGTLNTDTLTGDLVDKVFEASQELNVKAAGETLLINRQGAIYLVPKGEYRGPHLNRFEQTADLAALANFARVFLREGHDYRSADPAVADDIVRRVKQWVQQAGTTFDSSLSQTLAWKVLAREHQLDERLLAWREYFA